MSDIEVLPATPARFDEVEAALCGGGDGASCQCQWWLLTGREFEGSTREERERMLRAEVDEKPGPGLVARVDGAPAGWVRVGPRIRQPRLGRNRTFAPHSTLPWDDPDVWAITCFSIRREFRGQGVMTALLAGAVDVARGHGARAVEAYPIDTDTKKVSSAELFHGVLSVFLAAGFTEVARTHPHRTIVTLDLTR